MGGCEYFLWATGGGSIWWDFGGNAGGPLGVATGGFAGESERCMLEALCNPLEYSGLTPPLTRLLLVMAATFRAVRPEILWLFNQNLH